jgi:hypothetical protein
MATIKTQGDAQLGSVSNPEDTDLLYLLRSPYTGTGKDGYISWSNLKGKFEIGDRTIYNAITDGGIVADYVDRLNPGTDQRSAIINWIETVGLPAGKRKFYFPPGHYRIDEGAGVESTVLDIDGYDDVEIFGVPGLTFFHSPQGLDLTTKNNPFIRVGWGLKTGRPKDEAYRFKLHGITFQNDLYMTNSEQSDDDNGLAWGWLFIPPWTAGEEVEKGDRRRSTADDRVIEYQEDAVCAGTEPSWVASGADTDNGYDVSVKPLAVWAPSTVYSQYDYALFQTGSASTGNLQGIGGTDFNSCGILMSAGASQTSGSTEPTLSKPSGDGSGGDNSWTWVSLNLKSREAEVYNCTFRGLCGFSQAGGNALSINSGTGVGQNQFGYHHIHNNVFEDFYYGTACVGYYHHCTFRENIYRRTTGWMSHYGTYNAHDHYCQGGHNTWIAEQYDRHFNGIQIKIHANVSNVPLIGNKIIGCTFRNWKSWAVVLTDPDTYVDAHPNFIPQSTSGSHLSASPSQQVIVDGCTFQIEKEAYDNYSPWGYTYNIGDLAAIQSGGLGMLVTGCTFLDTHGVDCNGETETNYDGSGAGVQVSNCSFRSIFRKGTPFIGTIRASNCEFDYRALASVNKGITLDDYAELRDSRVFRPSWYRE